MGDHNPHRAPGDEGEVSQFIAFLRDEMAFGAGNENIQDIPGVRLEDLTD
jgi:hypothetical protein